MLVNCAVYKDGKKLADITLGEVEARLANPGCFVWVALADAAPEEIVEIGRSFHLHELALEDAMCGHHRPKIEEYGDSLFAVVQLVELINGELNLGEVDIFVGHNYVLSIRNRSKEGFLGVRQRCEREPHLLKKGPAFVLYALIDAAVDRYFPVLDALETEIEEIEAQIFAHQSTRETIERLYDLKVKVLTLRHATVPLMENIGKLYGGRVPALVVGLQDYFRDVFDHLGRIEATIEVLRENIATVITINLSLVTFEAGEVNKRLAGWAGIFAVATLFAGIWGMNFKAMPELEWEYGYPTALCIIVAVCGFMFWRFRKSGWI